MTVGGASGVVRVVAGVVFIIAGIAKFAAYGSEVEFFRRYGLPVAEVWVVVIGLIEFGGGVLLLVGRWVAPTALLLAAVMVGAIVVSGIGQGEVVPSLTLAPALLLAMLYLLWAAWRDQSAPGRAGSGTPGPTGAAA
jgi:putative oxidoreductase